MQDTFGVSAPSEPAEPRVAYQAGSDEASRLFMKKTIVVGNVSK